MKLAVFGATGRTGKHLVRQALEAGHEVVAFARNPAKLADVGLPAEHERLRVVEGDVKDTDRVAEAVEGADAVLSAIGHTKTSAKDVQTVGTQNILRAMERHGVRRLVSETGAGVADPKDGKRSFGAKLMGGMLKLFAPAVLEDAEGHAAALRAGDAAWTMVRAPRLTDGDHTGAYETGYLDLGPGAKISRADVADFMLKLALEGGYEREAPMITA